MGLIRTENKPIPTHWFPVNTPKKREDILYCCSKCRAYASITDNNKQEKCGNCGAKMNIKD